MPKYLVVFGTRPEAIKMAPVLQALRAEPQNVCVACSTGQHQELLAQVLSLFRIKPRHQLRVMLPNQQLSGLTSLLLSSLDEVMRAEQPDRVLVQGDTTTAMVAALAACYLKIPVAHVEAGVRSNNPLEPFPEEMNRKVIDVIADVFFAPTVREQHHLLREGISPDHIFVTGNTCIDALCHVSALPFSTAGTVLEKLPLGKKKILVATIHRRESHGGPLKDICQAFRVIARRYKDDAHLVIPVHPNPNVRETVQRCLGGLTNVTLSAPLGYQEMIGLMKVSHFAMTDSGGLSEELTWLGKPALMLRKVTDRREAVDAGAAILVGVDPQVIVAAATELMENEALYGRMAQHRKLFGDGLAAHRIANVLQARHAETLVRRPMPIAIPAGPTQAAA
jgi:UDP-N-acetylglucosamine 2-epimerase (non-hydrolysing)